MAERWQQRIDDFHRLKAIAEQTRAQSIRSQVSLGLTFCRIAQFELESDHLNEAQALIQKTRQTLALASQHLDEPNHVPASEVEKLRAELAELQSRIACLEESAR